MAIANPERAFSRLLTAVIETEASESGGRIDEPVSDIRLAGYLGVSAASLIGWKLGESIPSRDELVQLIGGFRYTSRTTCEELVELHQQAQGWARTRAATRRAAAERRRAEEKLGELPPKIVRDVPGPYRFKPDPMEADNPEEFVEMMKAFREWAGGAEQFSSRKLAHWSGGAFSAATINKILSDSFPFKDKPKVKLSYLIGFIRACGGSDEEVQEWTTAWRRAYKQLQDTRASSWGDTWAAQTPGFRDDPPF